MTNSARTGAVGVGVEELGHAHHRQLPARSVGRRAHHRQTVDELVAPRADAAGVAAAPVAPCAHERGQAGERAEEHRTVLVVLGPDEGADRRRSDGAVHGGEPFDVGRRRRRTWPRARSGVHSATCVGQVVEADGVGLHPVGVDEPVADQHVHHRQHQRDVGAGQRLHEPVGAVGGDGADRVDHDDLGPVGPGLLDDRPQVPVGEPGVGAPQQDQLRVRAAPSGRVPCRCRGCWRCRRRRPRRRARR